MTAACRFFSYGLEKNFRPDVYEEFEKRTLQVRCNPRLLAACSTYAMMAHAVHRLHMAACYRQVIQATLSDQLSLMIAGKLSLYGHILAVVYCSAFCNAA